MSHKEYKMEIEQNKTKMIIFSKKMLNSNIIIENEKLETV